MDSRESEKSKLYSQAVRGTAYVCGTRYVMTLYQFCTGVVLARLLVPEYFGIIALGTVIFSIINRLGQLGFDAALRHRSESLDRAMKVHRTLSTLIGTILILISSVVALSIYGLSEKRTLAIIVFLLGLTRGFEYVFISYKVMLEKEMMFKITSLSNAAAVLTATAAAMGMAWRGMGIWSLVPLFMVYTIVDLLIIRACSPVRIGFSRDREMMRWFFRFGPSWHMFLSGTAAMFAYEFDKFIVGAAAGTRALGFYSKAYNWSMLPTSNITHIVSGVALSTYAKVQKEKERLRRTFNMILHMICRVSLPVAVLMLVAAPEGILLLLGEKWQPMTLIFQILFVYAVLRSLLDDCNSFFFAIGKPRVCNNVCILMAGTLVFTVLPLVLWFGAVGAAVGIDLTVIIGVVAIYRKINLEFRIDYKKIFLNPLLACAAAFAAALILPGMIPGGTLFIDLMMKVGAVTLTYILVMLWLEGRDLLNMGRQIFTFARA